MLAIYCCHTSEILETKELSNIQKLYSSNDNLSKIAMIFSKQRTTLQNI